MDEGEDEEVNRKRGRGRPRRGSYQEGNGVEEEGSDELLQITRREERYREMVGKQDRADGRRDVGRGKRHRIRFKDITRVKDERGRRECDREEGLRWDS